MLHSLHSHPHEKVDFKLLLKTFRWAWPTTRSATGEGKAVVLSVCVCVCVCSLDLHFWVECSIPVPRKYTILPEVSSLYIFMRVWPTYHVIICIVKMATASTAASSLISSSMRLRDLYNVTSNDTTLRNLLTQK